MRKYIYIFSLLVCGILTSALFTSCSKDIDEEVVVQQENTCKLTFRSAVKRYNAAEVTSVWNDKDCIYLLFINGDKRVSGKAIYSKADDSWELYYNGSIQTGTTATCYAYFFEKEYTVQEDKITLTPQTAIYCDLKATYTKTANEMCINATLIPLTGRIRFVGQKGLQFNVSGLQTYTSLNLLDGTIATNSDALELIVNENGTTDSIHALLVNDSRALTISYDKMLFTRICDHPILDAGKSGYMQIPTEQVYNGWDLLKITEPILGNVAVSSIGITKASFSSKIVGTGNSAITDCGFCYSQSAQPTIADNKVSYGIATADFGKTVTGLSENTAYYVRAYAVNSAGVGYSEAATFKTLEVTVPSLSVVTLGTISNTSVDLEAQVTDLGNGTLVNAGFVYSTDPYPTLDSHLLACGKTTNLQSKATNLIPETTYYVRAYATNEKGTNYGEEISFTTAKTVVNPYTTLTLESSYGSTTLDIAKVDGGTFMMGAQSTSSAKDNYDKNAYSDEKPVHQVTVSSFYIGKTPVTQYQWYVVMGSYPNISSAYGFGDDYPIYNITYAQCQQFIKKLNTMTGKTFRLPTEAEWEYAARGGMNSNSTKYSGSASLSNVGWYSSNAGGKTHPVAKKDPNELNIYDMSGNVWEWCSDWYGNYSSAVQTNPTGAASGAGRVIRGGAYSDSPTECRVSVRSYTNEATALPTLGLRLVME